MNRLTFFLAIFRRHNTKEKAMQARTITLKTVSKTIRYNAIFVIELESFSSDTWRIWPTRKQEKQLMNCGFSSIIVNLMRISFKLFELLNALMGQVGKGISITSSVTDDWFLLNHHVVANVSHNIICSPCWPVQFKLTPSQWKFVLQRHLFIPSLAEVVQVECRHSVQFACEVQVGSGGNFQPISISTLPLCEAFA